VTASADPVGVETGTTGDLVRHRQTKGAATGRVDLKSPASHFDSTDLTPWSLPQRTAGNGAIEPIATRLGKIGSPPYCCRSG